MLIAQPGRIRIWLATLVAAVYAFGILGPALAFSMERNVSIVHSLMEDHGGAVIIHIHHDDTDHETPGKQGPQVGHHCCGVFAFVALSGSHDAFPLSDIARTFVRSDPADVHALQRPGRLDRPPRHHAVT